MGSFLGFAEVTFAILIALGLALLLEWASLFGFTSLISLRRERPSRQGQ